MRLTTKALDDSLQRWRVSTAADSESGAREREPPRSITPDCTCSCAFLNIPTCVPALQPPPCMKACGSAACHCASSPSALSSMAGSRSTRSCVGLAFLPVAVLSKLRRSLMSLKAPSSPCPPPQAARPGRMPWAATTPSWSSSFASVTSASNIC